ncbi:hypothetical protein [Haloimpatiens massiliensis]|uniref:hypothetical protein n=1 Tax=Haloimpatiens massiliensis TaxID=1658110 RepID=UPI000C835347|nr:hypothetical protein [Haloimpatiens massiliensis]
MRRKRTKRRRRERNNIIVKNVIMAAIVIIISLISYYNTFHLKERTSWIIQFDGSNSSGHIKVYKENIKNYSDKIINIIKLSLKY